MLSLSLASLSSTGYACRRQRGRVRRKAFEKILLGVPGAKDRGGSGSPPSMIIHGLSRIHRLPLRAADTAQGLAKGTQIWAFRGRRVVSDIYPDTNIEISNARCFLLPAGDTAQGVTKGTQFWAFRGRRVVAALADQLLAQQDLGAATDVLVAGDSAGGVSALNNADFMLQRVRSFLPRCANKQVQACDICKHILILAASGINNAMFMLQHVQSIVPIEPFAAQDLSSLWICHLVVTFGMPKCRLAENPQRVRSSASCFVCCSLRRRKVYAYAAWVSGPVCLRYCQRQRRMSRAIHRSSR